MTETSKSLLHRVEQLKEGECFSQCERIPLDEITPKSVSKRLHALRNTLNQAGSRARAKTEQDYRVESGQFMTYDGSAITICAIITRTDEAVVDDI